MTDHRAADQIIADSFGPPISRRELAERIVLLENIILSLQEANEGLVEQLAEARDQIKTLQAMLSPLRRRKPPAGTSGSARPDAVTS